MSDLPRQWKSYRAGEWREAGGGTDRSSEVRRAALYNLPRTPANLPYILARTRDIDPVLRRTVYHGSLSSAGLPDARVLSIAQREDVVRNGLGDREGNVRKAAAGMLGGWFDQAGCDVIEVSYTVRDAVWIVCKLTSSS